jgi:hypothetical protein
MRSEAPGDAISAAEVTNISPHGFWLMVDDREIWVPFAEFPWFREAPVAAICEVARPRPDHLHWPALDVDLTLESILHPERYPLVAKHEALGTRHWAFMYLNRPTS